MAEEEMLLAKYQSLWRSEPQRQHRRKLGTECWTWSSRYRRHSPSRAKLANVNTVGHDSSFQRIWCRNQSP